MSSNSSQDKFKRSLDEVSGIYLAALRNGQGTIAPVAKDTDDDDSIIYRDETTEKLCVLAESVARRPTTVLLTGETGVGKEVFARFIHRQSKRSDGPMISVNCAGLTPSLLESELFGHEKGAFSGAVDQHIGVFERAQNGTLLLDEISEIPPPLQAKLLRVIQERELVRVGGSKVIDVDIRIIATTNRDLEEYVAEGHFRQDLFFRLNVFPLNIPPLRRRREDIEPLAEYYTRRMVRLFEVPVQGLTGRALRKLEAYDFPGNIRELINIIERALILVEDADLIDEDHIILDKEEFLTPAAPAESGDADHIVKFRAGDDQLTDIRRVIIEETLERYNGNRSLAARKLGVSTRTIRNKLKDYESDDHT